MSDMEDLELHAVGSHSDAPAEEPHVLMTPSSTSSGHYSPAKDSSYHQGDASWDPVWSHAHFSPSQPLQSLQCGASEGGSSELLAEWEVLTEPGTPVSHCSGSPARCVTPGLSPHAADPAVSLLPQMAQMQPLSTAATPQSPAAADAPCHPAGEVAEQQRVEVVQGCCAAAMGLARPGSGSFSGSLDSADHLDSPYSADLVIASVEAFRAAKQRAVGPAAAAALAPTSPPPKKAVVEETYEYVHAFVGPRLSRLWEWLERIGGRAGRWTSSHLSALHSYVSALRCEAIFPPDLLQPAAARAAGGKGRSGNPLARTVFVQGAMCVALAAALAVYMADHRRLETRLRQKDAELAALIMKVFSLQESLQGARRLPVICHAMAPMKAQSYL
uniref:Uncharacterized protein n=1 Tax=Tetraselmis chuii TaxID=63592 RepID=A0A7S1SHQ5_9CHLO|mmetsp:Transcript_11178/g.20161  ORF Transcript_11178/g.20161 Transcript_11178/m.20161 type:complete len:387 (+) Transcript_11178:116-1276(+)|eukprot:CAMPEP_0177785076 /NCGR_PEP_ID=MMETSP0491_2-20121128/20087_1 /TAXON_ID=63592 /ORGANISM="Tetraselmis chuii, Strain PLY429" /LENGTH=386 /DNA_ID=CAMNT_0019305977 /DNA_START=91 /DNA_END=1251 /DNA_ORIENTATION=-